MLRGYRLYVLALGLVILGASPPKENGQQPQKPAASQVERALADIATAQREIAKPSDLDKPCQEGDNKRSSDLCAQWKAADAAKSAANATWLFGALGTLIGSLTLAAAAAAAYFAMKAADHTETGAKAAHDANRPWIEIEVCKADALDFSEGGISLRFDAVLRNRGNSPAVRSEMRGALAVEGGDRLGKNPAAAAEKVKSALDDAIRNPRLEGPVIFPGAAPEIKFIGRLDASELDLCRGEGSVFRVYFTLGVDYAFGDQRGRTTINYSVLPSGEENEIVIPVSGDGSIPVKLWDNFTGSAT